MKRPRAHTCPQVPEPVTAEQIRCEVLRHQAHPFLGEDSGYFSLGFSTQSGAWGGPVLEVIRMRPPKESGPRDFLRNPRRAATEVSRAEPGKVTGHFSALWQPRDLGQEEQPVPEGRRPWRSRSQVKMLAGMRNSAAGIGGWRTPDRPWCDDRGRPLHPSVPQVSPSVSRELLPLPQRPCEDQMEV